MFGNGFGDAGVYLPGDGDDFPGPGEIGEGNELEISFGLPMEADAGFAEYGIVPTFSVGDHDCVMNDCFNWNRFYNDLAELVNGIVDYIYFNGGIFIC